MSRVVKIGSMIFGAMFLLAAVVQYNDPDPVIWIIMYGSALAACVMAVTGRAQPTLAGLTGAVALVWAILLLPRVLGQVNPGALFQETGMATLEIEEAREAIGLLLVALWMAVLFVVGVRTKRASF